MRSGFVEPTICRTTVFEWTDDAPGIAACEISTVIDECPKARVVPPAGMCHAFEAIEECCRHDSTLTPLGVPLVCNFREPWHWVTAFRALYPSDRLPADDGMPEWYFNAAHMAEIARESGAYVASADPVPMLQSFVDSWRNILDVCARDNLITGYLVAGVQIETALTNLGFEGDLPTLFGKCEWSRCKGLTSFASTAEQYVRSGRKPRTIDAVDLDHAHLVAYADFSIVERGLRHYICAGDSDSKATTFARVTDLMPRIRAVMG